MNGLGRRIIVTAFEGWNDAGEAATAALQQLRDAGSWEVVHSVDPELYFDYQYTRPTVRRDPAGDRVLHWPETVLLRPVAPTGDREIWLLVGVEPARAWQAFATEIIDVALREDVSGIVTLGSMMADAPHTRPISVFRSSENEALRAELDLDRSLYEGPVGIVTVLCDAAERVGIPSASLWASIPHYIAGHTPSPKATLALIERFEEIAGTSLPHGDLRTAAAAWEASIDAAAADDEDMAEYIHQLEQQRDAWDSPQASGDAIAREFEQYLRRDGNDPRKP